MSRLLAILFAFAFASFAHADPRPETYWNVDDVRPGMKGLGRTVMKGTKVENVRRRSPRRPQEHQPRPRHGPVPAVRPRTWKDRRHRRHERQPDLHRRQAARRRRLRLALSARSRSPASRRSARCTASSRPTSAATWPSRTGPRRVGLRTPLPIGGKEFDVRHRVAGLRRSGAGGRRRPVAGAAADAAGRHGLHAAQPSTAAQGRLQRQRPGADAGRAAPGDASPRRRRTRRWSRAAASGRGPDHRRLRPVRHRHGDAHRGQPRLRLGPSVHGPGRLRVPADDRLHPHRSIRGRRVSFKMGSPLRTVGVINADVSTCIAGWLGRKPDMLPVRMTVPPRATARPKTFNVQIARASAHAGHAGLHRA